tara:strand:- start:363 stop:545 length:183 start_codon:yes stop_codon:yes gene_type:complete
MLLSVSSGLGPFIIIQSLPLHTFLKSAANPNPQIIEIIILPNLSFVILPKNPISYNKIIF